GSVSVHVCGESTLGRFCASRGDRCWYDPERATAFLRAFCHSRHLLLVRGLCRGDGNSLRPIDLFVAHKAPVAGSSRVFLWRVAGITLFAVGAVVWLMERRSAAAPIAPEKLSAIAVEELLDGGNTRGPANAPVKIVMFSDLWCSVCRAVHGPLMDYQSAHPDHVQVIFRHRPLYGIPGHETSETAAILSEIAAEQGRFWPF